MIEIWLNGVKVAIDENTKIAYTLQNNDFLKSISDVQVSYTNLFKIPLKPNINTFDQLGITGHQSTKPYDTMTAKIVDDGIELFSDGKAIIGKKQGDYLEIMVVFESGLFDTIKGSSIRDLTLTSYNHDRTPANIATANSSDVGYRYFTNLIFTAGKTDIDMLNLLPCLREDVIFDAILNDAGFTKTWSDEAETEIGDNFILPITGVDDEFIDDIETEYDAEVAEGETLTGTFPGSAPYEIEYSTAVFSKSVSASGTKYYRFRVHFNSFIVNSITQAIGSELYVPVFIIDFDGDTQEFNPFDPTTTAFVMTATEEQIFLSSGQNQPDKVKDFFFRSTTTNPDFDIYLKVTSLAGAPSANEDFDIDYDIDFQVTTEFISESDLTKAVSFNDILPDVDQATFLKESLTRYACSIKKDKLSNAVTIKRLENILADRANAEDWSNKIIEEISTEYQATEFAQSSKFNYADEQDGGIMAVDNDNLENEKDVFNSIFGGDLAATKIAIMTQEIGDLGEFESLESEEITSKIGGAVTGSGTEDLLAFGSDTTTNVNSKELNELDLQDNIDDHYPTINSIVERLEKTTFKIKMTKEDIYNFDPFKIKFLKQKGSYFYVGKIRNIINGIGTAELYKIPA